MASENQKKAMRARRFASDKSGKTAPSNGNWRTNRPPHNKNDADFEEKLVGTCEQLEKCYLRLTAPAKDTEVRPRHVLVKSLARVNELWATKGEYNTCSELLKSIRQDLTVQGIRDELAVEVYETHARLALQAQDAPELNVCQSMLKSLYNESPSRHWPNKEEFTACRLLYYVYTKDLADLTLLVSEVLLSPTPLPKCLVHALNVVKSWLLGNHHYLFKLYATAPPLSSAAMGFFIRREREFYFRVILKAYRPFVTVTFVKTELKFENESSANEFLKELGHVVFNNSAQIDCKATLENFNSK
ncbi:leukocyte receptor cluster [Nesidiocoris tenuis]|uniref:Leukocyte receptor cluster n=1 Tax=Nesidiocoris tenuis TaxID=355587 RepID=A0ABN7AYK6_9HEMI|nr:leukocyte receptor cluster [Nesidiocoris tenuis]